MDGKQRSCQSFFHYIDESCAAVIMEELGGVVKLTATKTCPGVSVDEPTASKIVLPVSLSKVPTKRRFSEPSSASLDEKRKHVSQDQMLPVLLHPMDGPAIQPGRLETASGDITNSAVAWPLQYLTPERAKELHPPRLAKSPQAMQYVCAKAHGQTSSVKVVAGNTHITDALEELLMYYEIYKTNQNKYVFKIKGLQATIKKLKNAGEIVDTKDKAERLGIKGKKTLEKISYILDHGTLELLENANRSEDYKAIKTFLKVYGVGSITAAKFFQRGWRTLEDLRGNLSMLTPAQKVGVELFEDLQVRIPRSEVKKMYEYINSVAKEISSSLILEVCGSYRRGKENCGDIDILISHPDGHSHKGVLPRLIERLKESNFITHDLVLKPEQIEGSGQSKYMCACRLPGGIHRHLDLIVTPWHEWAPAILYFTGKQGWALSQHALRVAVDRRGQEKITDGIPVALPSEKDLFEFLNLEYRVPSERNA